MSDFNVKFDETEVTGIDISDGDIDITVEDAGQDQTEIVVAEEIQEGLVLEDDGEDIEVEYEEQTLVPIMATTHDMLTHRDYPDQHPIKSISYLTDELSGRPESAISDAIIMAL